MPPLGCERLSDVVVALSEVGIRIRLGRERCGLLAMLALSALSFNLGYY